MNSTWEPVTFGQRTSRGKIRVQLADLVKVGPEGYIHGFICVRPPCGKYSEAVRESHGGKTVNPATGQVIGRDLKREPGDRGYSIKYFSPGSKTGERLSGQYETRQDASKAAVMLHNIELMRDHPGLSSGMRDKLSKAAQLVRSGDHSNGADELVAAIMEAKPKENAADLSVAQHLMHGNVFDALKKEAHPVPDVVIPDGAGDNVRIAAGVPVKYIEGTEFSGVKKRDTESAVRKVLAAQAALVPDVVRHIDSIRFDKLLLPKGEYHGTSDAHFISIHPSVVSDGARATADRMRAERFWVPDGTEMHEHAITHEVGHAVAAEAFGTTDGPMEEDFWRGLSAAMNVPPPDSIRGKVVIEHTNAWLRNLSVKSRVMRAVSGYGAKEASELLAELWIEYSASDNPRPPAKFYGEYVMNRFKMLHDMGITRVVDVRAEPA